MDAELRQTITKYALQNAVKFNGKANLGDLIYDDGRIRFHRVRILNSWLIGLILRIT